MCDQTKAVLPLCGFRVLDFTHVYQGPVGTQLLADYGADVIKVERLEGGDWSRAWGPFVKGVSLPFANLNRNKRSIAINLKTDEGRAIIHSLVQSSDVLVHNFRVGVMEKLGFGYEAVSKLNPRLVYASSSGWGDHGPDVERHRAGHDMMARAEAGWFVDRGENHAPMPGGISIDYPAGLMLMQGILMALLHRERTGCGQRVTTDLLSVAFHAHAWEGASDLNADRVDEPARIGGTEAAIDKAFLTRDGAIEISPVFSDNALRDLSIALGLEDLSQRPQFASQPLQIRNRCELNRILAEAIKRKTTDQWMNHLEAHGVLCARVRTFTEASEDPQIHANRMIVRMHHPRAGPLTVLGTPLRLHGTPPLHRRHAPDLGADGPEILTEAGYDPEAIEDLQTRGVVA